MSLRSITIVAAALLVVAVLASSCSSTRRGGGESSLGTYYTQTNLHPDESRGRLYAVNYQQDGFIPIGSKVTFVELNEKRMAFVVEDTKKTYYYYNHQQADEPFNKHLMRFFAKNWDPTVLDKLSEDDREGIEEGMAYVGMSRQGVVYAIGYPPLLENPNPKASSWRYWKSRFNTMEVVFDKNDIVVKIKN